MCAQRNVGLCKSRNGNEKQCLLCIICVPTLIIRRLYFAVGPGQVVQADLACACAHANFSERSVPKHSSMYGRCFYCISAIANFFVRLIFDREFSVILKGNFVHTVLFPIFLIFFFESFKNKGNLYIQMPVS